MATSSPLSSLPESQRQNPPSSSATIVPRYRPANQLPFELAQHVLTYFEETLFTQAFSFLTSLVNSGAGSLNPTAPVVTPSPVHLALSATLAVHPTLTTRTTSKEKWDQANAALRLLRLTNKVLGPVNANFSTAFEFKHYDTRSRKGDRRGDDVNVYVGTHIESPYTTTESIWTRAEDFWHIVGWSFNCSCLDGMYAARWSQWVLWLEFMIQALEDDWKLHYRQQTSEESLMMAFIENTAGGHSHERRIMRAIFADGTTRPMNEFREIFKNELKGPKKDADKIKKREVERVNVEEELYGDYLESDNPSDDDYSQSKTLNAARRSRTPSTRRVTPRNSGNSLRSDYEAAEADSVVTTPNGALLGGTASLNLRLRLLHLLSHVSGAIPESFVDLDDLYTFFVEFTKPLPLRTFFAITSSRVLSPDAHSTLCELLLQRLLEHSAPAVSGTDEQYLTRTKLVKDYLPFASSRGDVLSNAKVSVCLEQLLRGMAVGGMLENLQPGEADKIRRAVRKGVEKRERRVKGESGGRKSGGGDRDEEAWCVLVESGKRMQRVVRDFK